MDELVQMRGDAPELHFPLRGKPLVLGRGRPPEVDVCLDAPEISRVHARIAPEQDRYYLHDLNSRNGTFLNGDRVEPNQRAELNSGDQIRIGSETFVFRQQSANPEPEVIVRDQVSVHWSNVTLFRQEPAQKLQAVLEISEQLVRSLDLEEILPRLLDHLLRLFPQADRALLLIREGELLTVRAIRTRRKDRKSGPVFSKTIANRVLHEGVGIMADDARDLSSNSTDTVNVLGIRSFLCVPVKSHAGPAVGVLQLDCLEWGRPFNQEDLHLLTTISLQVSVVLENASLHAERLQQERLLRELSLAREIQEGFLPHDFAPLADGGVELFGRVYPARQVSGDFYDFFRAGERRVGFCIADVMGKGLPAALFMVACRTLGRHLAQSSDDPAAALQRLNDSLAADNPVGMYVTMLLGYYDADTGEATLSCGGHPPALIRRVGGQIETLTVATGRVLGYAEGPITLANTPLKLGPGETMVLFTDGIPDAVAPDGKTRFGIERLERSIANVMEGASLESWADQIKTDIDRFVGSEEPFDDITLFLLRRPIAP